MSGVFLRAGFSRGIQTFSARSVRAGARYSSLTTNSPDDFFCFVGNVADGERFGLLNLIHSTNATKCCVSGNLLALHGPLDDWRDHPGGGVSGRKESVVGVRDVLL